jgi:hypothetical protein
MIVLRPATIASMNDLAFKPLNGAGLARMIAWCIA